MHICRLTWIGLLMLTVSAPCLAHAKGIDAETRATVVHAHSGVEGVAVPLRSLPVPKPLGTRNIAGSRLSSSAVSALPGLRASRVSALIAAQHALFSGAEKSAVPASGVATPIFSKVRPAEPRPLIAPFSFSTVRHEPLALSGSAFRQHTPQLAMIGGFTAKDTGRRALAIDGASIGRRY